MTQPTHQDDLPEMPADDAPEGGLRGLRYRGATGDPAFGLLLAIAISLGLTPILPAQADLRYTLAWGALAGVGVLAWLLGSADRVGQEDPIDLVWGVGFGVLLGMPFFLFGVDILERAARLLFPAMSAGTLLAYLVFVMPLAETLFFRGLMQRQYEFYIVGGLAALWNVILFFPVMWQDVLAAPAVSVVIIVALIAMNLMYSYVRDRNGLAAAWLCQITALLLMTFIPFL